MPAHSQQAALRELGDERIRLLVEQFADAFERGDVGLILQMLSEDATFQMPPYAGWRKGRQAIADSWLMPGGPGPRLRYSACRVNGQLALGTYLLDRGKPAYAPIAIDVLHVAANGSITGVVAFRSFDSFERFGMPETIPFDAAER